LKRFKWLSLVEGVEEKVEGVEEKVEGVEEKVEGVEGVEEV
jgi:hypothetical protein